MVEAELECREWTDQQNNRREAVTFRARQVLFEGRTTQRGSQDNTSTSAPVAVAVGDAPAADGAASEDDLPF